MKKWLPYMAGVCLLLLVIIAMNKKPARQKFDERITMRQADKIPYGTQVAKKMLPTLFLNATIYTDKKAPGNWDSIYADGNDQAVVLVCQNFNADEFELAQLLQFARRGNYVFIIAKSFSADAIDFFGFGYNQFSANEFMDVADDSISNKLEPPVFTNNSVYEYPGKRLESYFYQLDTGRTKVLGRTKTGQPNFIQMNAGTGRVFIHVSPLSFSNYFLLHKNNAAYFSSVFSVIPASVTAVLWNEYFLIKPNSSGKDKPNLVWALMKYPPFRWALLTGMAALLLYLLLGMRRRQNIIPPHNQPTNESLDFIKTLGRLYYDRRDHVNLARKMGAHFFDHVRTRYKLNSDMGDELFVQKLHFKSTHGEEEIRNILSFIRFADTEPAITDRQLADFYHRLELFYQTT